MKRRVFFFDVCVFVLSAHRGSRRRARNVDLEDLERTTKQRGSGASDDGSMALSEAVQWAAGALDKIQVRQAVCVRWTSADSHPCIHTTKEERKRTIDINNHQAVVFSAAPNI